MVKATDVDIAIAGGGMAGATLAWVLTQALPQLKLAIIEQQPASAPSASFDSRSIALAAGSVDLLKQWGLWSELERYGCPITDIQVSDRGHFGKAYLNTADYHQPALGQVLEVEYLGQVLQQKLAKATAVVRFQPDHIVAVTQQQEHCLLHLKHGAKLRARLLVIAEGGQSPTRQLAGFQVTEQAYCQTAVIANLAVAAPHKFRAYERFTANGPIALLPLPQQRYSLVWTCPPERAAELMQLSESAFLSEVQQAFGYRAGIFTKAGQRASYPLSLRRAEQIVKHRITLMGNSLHNVHPIAGQGFNLAIRDIAQLLNLLRQQPEDAGSYSLLRAYEKARQQDMQRVLWLTDALVRTFSNQSRIMALLRNTGLLAMLLCDELKRPLAEQAMGFRTENA
ncbi:2-octaprenyl-6-methoxyphenyl hydroxylase [Chromatiaceae bacterium AAb-1]|nr:2-octaprenyl-6-methoxyphenyl hydroxylase [Chromatiaceae bacterium AAb-1]